MLCPENTVFFISDICIPHTWQTVELGYNDKLYVTILNVSTSTSHISTILPGNYTPATFIDQIQTQFRTITSSFTATLDSNYGVVIRANTSNPAYAFKILTDDELSRGVYWYGG